MPCPPTDSLTVFRNGVFFPLKLRRHFCGARTFMHIMQARVHAPVCVDTVWLLLLLLLVLL